MPTAKLSDADPVVVATNHERLMAVFNEAHPELDLRGTVFGTTVLRMLAAGFGLLHTDVQRLTEGQSLLEIAKHPERYDDSAADAVFSNLRITRRPGTAAAGFVAIVVSVDSTVVVNAGSRFRVGSLEYLSDELVVARPTTDAVQTDYDVLLRARGDGRYVFTVPVTAAAAGPQYNIRRDAPIVPAVSPAHFVYAYAAADFTGGDTQETNAEALTRLTDGIAADGWYDRYSIPALVRRLTNPRAQVSVIGAGNPEMRRDRRWIWAMGGGGKVDVYVRTSDLPAATLLPVTASLVRINNTVGTWQFAIPRNTVPGFYKVDKVLKNGEAATAGGFAVTNDIRSTNLASSAGVFVPDITTVADGAYTAYQTAIIQFEDDETPLVGKQLGSTLTYQALVSGLPGIITLQNAAVDPAKRPIQSDVLVRAAVPCYVSVDISIAKSASDAQPDTAAISKSVAATINNLNFTGCIYSTQIADAVAAYLLSARTAVSAVSMFGRLRWPNGQWKTLQSATKLEIPHDPDNMVSAATVAFYCQPSDVSVEVTASGAVLPS